MAVVHREAELLAAAGPQADRPAAPAAAGAAPEPEPATDAARRPRRDRGATPWWRRSLGALRPLPAAGLATVLLAVGVGAGIALQGDSGPATRTVAADVAPAGGQAQLVVTGDHARLVAEGLRRPPRDRVYQVWVLRKGGTAPSPTDALFRTSARRPRLGRRARRPARRRQGPRHGRARRRQRRAHQSAGRLGRPA